MASRNQVRSSVSRMNTPNQKRIESDQMPQDSQEQSINMEQRNNTTDGTSQKRGRGMTTGISVEKKRRRVEKLQIVIHPLRNRIVGENAKDFKTEASVIIKQHAPLQYPHWKSIPMDIKRKMLLGMKQKFDFPDDFKARKIVYEQLNRQYRSYRRKLHEHYITNQDSEDIFAQNPSGVSREDWELLINYFESDDFKKVSARNKQNRQKLKMAHTCGTKSIAQSSYEDRNPETGEEPTRTSTWRKTRFSNKKNRWVDDASKEVYDEIVRLQSEPIEDGQDVMSEDEAFTKVLGQEKPYRLRGCGDGLKPSSEKGEKINVELQKENENLRRQAEEDKTCLEALKKENKEMALRLESLEAKLPEILQSLKQIGQVPSPNV